MKVYYSKDFRGHYPVGTAAVIVARDRMHARQLLDAELARAGLPASDYTLVRVELVHTGAAVILNDGNY